MRTILRATTLATSLSLAVSAPLDGQTASRVSLDQLMTPAERRAAGIDQLSGSQRAALEAWLAKYTSTVASVATSMDRETRGAPTPAPERPNIQRRGEPRQNPEPLVFRFGYTPDGARVRTIMNDGAFVYLDDGSMWEIYYSDRPSVDAWQRGEFVTIKRQGASVGQFDFQLQSSGAEHGVSARYAGSVRPGRGSRPFRRTE